jgi:hypothetical protein
MADSHPEAFRQSGDYRGSKDFRPIYSLIFLEGEEMHANQEVRDDKIRRRWAEFLEQDLPWMDAVMQEEEWIWEPARAYEESSGRSERFVRGDGDQAIVERPDEPDSPGTS